MPGSLCGRHFASQPQTRAGSMGLILFEATVRTPMRHAYVPRTTDARQGLLREARTYVSSTRTCTQYVPVYYHKTSTENQTSLIAQTALYDNCTRIRRGNRVTKIYSLIIRLCWCEHHANDYDYGTQCNPVSRIQSDRSPMCTISTLHRCQAFLLHLHAD
eukprot:scaffold492694_cov18-Prasinocladus_malaysianus.AAC.1